MAINFLTRCISDTSVECNVGESWLPAGMEIHSAPTYEKGVALELILNIKEGFANPLFLKETRSTAQNPIARITVEFETKCADESCLLYFVEVCFVLFSFRQLRKQ